MMRIFDAISIALGAFFIAGGIIDHDLVLAALGSAMIGLGSWS